MLSNDHEYTDALAALSTPLAHSPLGWTRRKFLMATAAGGATAAAATTSRTPGVKRGPHRRSARATAS